MRTSSNPLRWLGALGLIALTALLVACGGGGDDGGSSASTSTTGSSNLGSNGQVPIVVGTTSGVNLPSVSVMICAPGTSTCQTIDNVLLDTASYGLRIMSTAASGVLGSLPTQNAANGSLLANCGQFVSTYTWGSVRLADVKFGGQTASSLPIQIIGDLGSSNVPTQCSNGGTSTNTLATFGVNGILGIGVAPFDCGAYCVSWTAQSRYYACASSGACTQTTAALNAQVANPVPRFASNNNGVAVQMDPPVNGTATGTLTLGLPATLPAGVTRLATDGGGNVTGTFQGRSITNAFFDTGSNGYFFDSTAGATLPTCSSSAAFYCPSANVSLTAALTDGSNNLTVAFTIANAQALFNTRASALANLGGPFGINTALDFGMPHFYGRTIYFGMDLRSAGGTQAPFVAL